MKCLSYNKFFETISNKTRLNIVELLMKRGKLSVSDISNELGGEQSMISHNLKILAECHFLNVERKGKQRIYSLNKETIVPLMSLVDKHVKNHCCTSCKMKVSKTAVFETS